MHASELQRIQTLLSAGADEDANWTWSAQNQALWTQNNTLYQGLCDKWRGSETPATLYNRVDSDTNLPYPLNVGGPATNDRDILVTAAFVEMLQRILLLRSDILNGRIDTQGVVITGQPGIGKSTFLTFILAQLLSSHQVVLLVESTISHLFFQGKVYVRRFDSESSQHQHTYTGFHFLPTHTHRALHPIWALLDADATSPDSAIAIPTNSNVWPIQVSPPDGPLRYKCWRKQRRGCLWGMPLWTEEELLAGLSLQDTYAHFRSNLEEALQGHDDPTLRPTHMLDTLNLLNLSLNFSLESKSQSESINKALKTLLHNAILEFGPIPRDVYTAILSSLSSESAHQSHQNTLETLTLSRLYRLVLTFAHEHKFDTGAEHIIAIVPREGEGVPKLDAWDVRFKSERIASRMLDKALEEGKEGTGNELWVMFRSFRKVRAGFSMARWVFSIIGHRALCAPSPSPSTNSSLSTPIRMTSNTSSNPNSDAPLFSTRGSCGRSIITSDIPHNLCITREEGRKAVRVDLRDISDTVTLPFDDKYYIPIPINSVDGGSDPLFESFTIHRDEDTGTIIISVFRFTISESSGHAGSAGAYEEIREIVERVRKLVEEEEEEEEARLLVPTEAGRSGMSRNLRKASESLKVETKIKVAYFFVHPAPSSSTTKSQSQPVSWQWQMPDGWTDEYEGEVFSLQIPDALYRTSTGT